jgi:hypothetical protein
MGAPFSYPKLVGASEALPSPYFGLVEVELGPPGPLPAASPEEARRAYLQRGGLEDDAVLNRARASWEIELRREGPAPFDHYDGVLGIPVGLEERRFSVSEFLLAGVIRLEWNTVRTAREFRYKTIKMQ